ncbi:unnamed protein product, partial [Meganyctiphanes norvegica]
MSPSHQNQHYRLGDSILRGERVPYPLYMNNSKLKGFWTGFKSRLSNISIRTPETLSHLRLSIDRGQILQWFSNVKKYLVEAELDHILKDPYRVYNKDETGFAMGAHNS